MTTGALMSAIPTIGANSNNQTLGGTPAVARNAPAGKVKNGHSATAVIVILLVQKGIRSCSVTVSEGLISHSEVGVPQ